MNYIKSNCDSVTVHSGCKGKFWVEFASTAGHDLFRGQHGEPKGLPHP